MNNKSKAFYGGGYVSDYSEYVNPPKEDRKKIPVYSGVINYFPDAIKEVAKCSYAGNEQHLPCLLYTSPSPRDGLLSRMPSSA